jgi:predicted Rossmann-fold nucleotide-binding protein
MKAAALKTVARATAERLSGGQPGVMQAVVASVVTGAATAALTYRLLRSGGDGDG